MYIPKDVQELPLAPDDVREWILNNVAEGRYMIYSTKKDRAVCSYCGSKFALGEFDTWPKHNEIGYCPDCGEKVIFKSEGIGRKNLTELTRVMLFVSSGDSVYATISEVDISFTNLEPEIFFWLQAVYKFNNQEQTYHKHHPGWCYTGESWEQMRNIKVPSLGGSNWYFQPKRQCIHLYDCNLATVFNETDLRYADVPQVRDENNLYCEYLLQYVYLSAKYPSVEILRKSGFWRLIKTKMAGYSGSASVRWKHKDLRKILGLNKAQIREIKSCEFSMRELGIYKQCLKENYKVMPEAIYLIDRSYKDDEIKKHIKLGQAANYIHKQNEKYNKQDILSHYDDYLTECRKLGFNMTEKKTLFPKNFHKEHERTSALARELKEQIDTAEFQRMTLQITGMNEPYLSDGLLIRPATKPTDLTCEGQSLGNCVGGYSNRVIRGTSAILFIRRQEDSDKSFYCLELSKDKHVLQCYGKSNCRMTDEIKAFVDKWMDEVILKKNKKTKKQHKAA